MRKGRFQLSHLSLRFCNRNDPWFTSNFGRFGSCWGGLFGFFNFFFYSYFWVNENQQGMHPVRSRALCCTKASTLLGHIKGKGLAKQLCPDTSLSAENWHPHRTPHQLSCLLYSLGWLRSCFFCSHEYVHTSSVPSQLPSCHQPRRSRTSDGQRHKWVWEKSIKALQSSPGAIQMGICCKPYLFKHLVQISESSTPVRTTSLLSKWKLFASSASVLWAVSFWLDKFHPSTPVQSLSQEINSQAVASVCVMGIWAWRDT